MWDRLFYKLHQWGRTCLHCAGFSASDSLFCSICEKDLWHRHQALRLHQIAATEIDVWSLFDWYPDQDRKVSLLVMMMKGGRLQKIADFYARSLVAKLKQPNLPSKTILIPCPSARNRQHALVFAHSLGRILNLPVEDSLIKNESVPMQKDRSRSLREKLRFDCGHNYSQHHVIFIDDIVTTGATAKAAFRAVGRCRSFQVWCLAHRRLLATETFF